MINYSDEVGLSEKMLSNAAGLGEAEPNEAGPDTPVQRYTRGELLARIAKVEEAVVRGTAQMRDFEMFVCCKEELLRREVLHSNPKRASKP